MTFTTETVTQLFSSPFYVRVWRGMTDIDTHSNHSRRDWMQADLDRFLRGLKERPSQEDVAIHLLGLHGVTKVQVLDANGNGVVLRRGK